MHHSTRCNGGHASAKSNVTPGPRPSPWAERRNRRNRMADLRQPNDDPPRQYLKIVARPNRRCAIGFAVGAQEQETRRRRAGLQADAPQQAAFDGNRGRKIESFRQLVAREPAVA